MMLIAFALICSITLMFSRRSNSDQDNTTEMQAKAV